jgi:hypothetical protein
MLSTLVRVFEGRRYAMQDAFRERENKLLCTITNALDPCSIEALTDILTRCQEYIPDSFVFIIQGSLGEGLVSSIVQNHYGKVSELCYVVRQKTGEPLRLAEAPTLGAIHLAIKIGGRASNYKLVTTGRLALDRLPLSSGDCVVFSSDYSLGLGMSGEDCWVLITGFTK